MLTRKIIRLILTPEQLRGLIIFTVRSLKKTNALDSALRAMPNEMSFKTVAPLNMGFSNVLLSAICK
jgi:hypothetical protein